MCNSKSILAPMAGLGLLTTLVGSAGAADRVWTYDYNQSGQVISVDGPRIDVDDSYSYSYDAQGNLSVVTDPLGNETRYGLYNKRGQAAELIDSNNVRTLMIYDALGRLVERSNKHPSGDASKDSREVFLYRDASNLVSFYYDPVGYNTQYAYDDAGHLYQSLREDSRTRYDFDAMGNLLNETLRGLVAGGEDEYVALEKNRAYDERGRLIRGVDSRGQEESYSYDHNGNRIRRLDANGIATYYTYDAHNRMIETAGALDSNAIYAYDARDNLVSVTDPRGLVTRYTYDGLDNLIRTDSPDTGVTTRTYDEAGNLTQTQDARGAVTNYGYDALNRLVSVSYPGDSSRNIQYTFGNALFCQYCKGRLNVVQDNSGTTIYVRDHRGRVTSRNHVVDIPGGGNVNLQTRFTYDTGDNTTSITYPNGATVDFDIGTWYEEEGEWESGNTPWRVSWRDAGSATTRTLADRIVYEPFGPVKTIEMGNGLVMSREFNRDGHLQRQQITDLQDRTYTYDNRYDIEAITDNLDPGRSITYNHDALRRLTFVNSGSGSATYDYDPVGNRTARTVLDARGQRVETYAYAQNSNRLESVEVDLEGDLTTRNFTYDDAGNMTSDSRGDAPGINQEYDVSNRMHRVIPQ